MWRRRNMDYTAIPDGFACFICYKHVIRFEVTYSAVIIVLLSHFQCTLRVFNARVKKYMVECIWWNICNQCEDNEEHWCIFFIFAECSAFFRNAFSSFDKSQSKLNYRSLFEHRYNYSLDKQIAVQFIDIPNFCVKHQEYNISQRIKTISNPQAYAARCGIQLKRMRRNGAAPQVSRSATGVAAPQVSQCAIGVSERHRCLKAQRTSHPVKPASALRAGRSSCS